MKLVTKDTFFQLPVFNVRQLFYGYIDEYSNKSGKYTDQKEYPPSIQILSDNKFIAFFAFFFQV